MKHIFLIIFSIPLFLFAQSVVVDDVNCFQGSAGGGIDEASLSGSDGGSPARNIYTGIRANGSQPFRIIWDSGDNRWEVQLNTNGDADFETLIHSNTFASAPNPPSLGAGTWVDETGGTCGGLTQFDGSGTQSALPVDFLYFKAETAEEHILLQWGTASEENNDRFDVLYSSNGKSFELLGEVKGNGNKESLSTYSFKVPYQTEGLHYFRLKQIDMDGQHSMSNTLSIDAASIDLPSPISIYPNPNTNGKFILRLRSSDPGISNSSNRKLRYIIYDMTAKALASENISFYAVGDRLELDLSSHGKGIFLMKVVDGKNSWFQKLRIL